MSSDPTATFTPLCFDRADFGRQDFNVEKFLLKARRRGNSFEEIREDLRVFLKIIQNSMIELINKDYADFVQLSSNLAGLRGSVEKLNSEVSDLVGDFNEISSKIQQSVDLLSTKFEEKNKIQTDLELFHATIAAHHKLDQLKHILSKRQLKNSISFLDRINYQLIELKTLTVVKNEKLGSEFQTNFLHCVDVYQNILEKLFVNEINSLIKTGDRKRNSENLHKMLNSFNACGRVDSAHAVFLNEFVDGEFRQIFSPKKLSVVPTDKPSQLEQVLNCLVKLYKKYVPFFDASNCMDCQVPTFLSDCLLTALLSCLDDKFGTLLFPTDPNVFRKSYSLVINFFGTWWGECFLSSPATVHPATVNSRLVRMIFNKFNLSVYFQLRKQDVWANLEKSFEIKFRSTGATSAVSLHFTSTLLNSVQQIWSGDENGVYLPPLTSKCFELTFLLLNRLEHFLGEVSHEFAAKGTASTTGHESPSVVNGSATGAVDSAKVSKVRPTLLAITQADIDHVINVASDVFVFEQIFETLYKSEIIPKLKPHTFMGISSTVDSALAEFSIGNIQIYDQCLNDTFQKLHIRVDRLIGETLRDVLARKVASYLSAVDEIPRQYRWTRKESPSQASSYVSQAFQCVRDFVDCAKNRLPEDRISSTVASLLEKVVQAYATDIKSVVEGVDKISSSLNKLKRSGKSASNVPDSGTTASDDDKIRMQLNLDVKEFCRLVSSLQLPVDICDMNILDEIINAKSYNIE